jgi:hypothetical protein
LFGPPRVVEREEASRLHGRLCDALKRDDVSFRYNPAEQAVPQQSRGFAIQMERPEGRGGFRVTVDYKGADNPLRLLMEFHWAPSEVHVHEQFDITAETVFDVLEGEWQKVMAECRIRAQCSTRSGGGLDFLRDELLRLDGRRADALGSPVAFASVNLRALPATQTQDPLANPRRELTAEVLREDPKAVYLELMSQWAQFPVAGKQINLAAIRRIDEKPSSYIEDGTQALRNWVDAFAGDRQGR